MQKNITILQSFLALEKFLEKQYKRTKFDDIQFLLGGMDIDPAFWEDWKESAQYVISNKKDILTISQAFQAVIKFLEKWYEFIKSNDITFILSGMEMNSVFYEDWVEAVKTVLKEKKLT